ncbi:MAG TPA: MTH1187 family thiamine-binding protein [Firmicutes bacterium]|nr:MTH1187 family thiamine-binding protein [Bacillota bacterium]
MALLEISVVPVGTTSASISSFVTRACQAVEKRGLEYQVTPTATVIEGELPQLIQVAQEMHQLAFQGGTQRVITNMTIDERKDKRQDLDRAVTAVTTELQ